MRRIVCLVMVITFLLVCLQGDEYAAASGLELEWEHTRALEQNRDLDTVSVQILENISTNKGRSVYRGITITRPTGTITTIDGKIMESSATGVGPIYLIRNEKYRSGKLSASVDMSGGFILYDRAFPATGRAYNFMWRLGPQLNYRFNETSSLNVGYMLMHVSNGLRSHNPGYDAHGVTLGFVTKL